MTWGIAALVFCCVSKYIIRNPLLMSSCAKAYKIAEHPLYALENNLPIDVQQKLFTPDLQL
jgi:hypothetical protein